MKPTLYLLIGYPGSGKTTVANYIHELTGAVHIWADKERSLMFGAPSHSHSESLELYRHLNQKASSLLAEGKSVIFDTNFNFYKDREHLRKIAEGQGATTKLVWLTTDKTTAEQRATQDSEHKPTRLFGNMEPDVFHRIADHLESPKPAEAPIMLNGVNITSEKVQDALGL